MTVGFTGTRHGLTSAQCLELRASLVNLRVDEFHHGDCVGGDETAHEIAFSLKIPIIIHPPNVDKYRAGCTNAMAVKDPVDYHTRNRSIVLSSNVLIACPRGTEEAHRSGTWSTIRFAKKRNRQIIIINPDGKINYVNRFLSQFDG